MSLGARLNGCGEQALLLCERDEMGDRPRLQVDPGDRRESVGLAPANLRGQVGQHLGQVAWQLDSAANGLQQLGVSHQVVSTGLRLVEVSSQLGQRRAAQVPWNADEVLHVSRLPLAPPEEPARLARHLPCVFVGWSKIRRHAEKLAGGKDAAPEDVQMWHDRIRKACRKGDIPARRQGDAGDYLVVWKEVERWFRTEFPEV